MSKDRPYKQARKFLLDSAIFRHNIFASYQLVAGAPYIRPAFIDLSVMGYRATAGWFVKGSVSKQALPAS